jgi:hypothetical protein
VRPANITIAVIAERYRIIIREKSRDLVDLLVPYFIIAPSHDERINLIYDDCRNEAQAIEGPIR